MRSQNPFDNTQKNCQIQLPKTFFRFMKNNEIVSMNIFENWWNIYISFIYVLFKRLMCFSLDFFLSLLFIFLNIVLIQINWNRFASPIHEKEIYFWHVFWKFISLYLFIFMLYVSPKYTFDAFQNKVHVIVIWWFLYNRFWCLNPSGAQLNGRVKFSF